MTPAERLAWALGGERAANGWRAMCPAHDDANPSLSLKDADDGRVLFYCFAGCTQAAVLAALRARDLWPGGERTERPANKNRPPVAKPDADDCRPILPVPPDAPRPTFEHSIGRPSGVWNYNAEDGRLLGYVGRFDNAARKKEFRSYVCCRAPDGRLEWRWKGFPESRPLYRLDRLAARPDAWVLLTEGEKTADSAAELFTDHAAITSPGGSNAAGKADWSPLKGRKVAIWPDADEPGRKYAEHVAELARRAGAAKVVVVAVPEDFPEGWDLADPPPPGWDLDGLRRLLDEAAFGKDTPVPDFATVLDEAADLDSVSYDRLRDELAEQLGIRKSTLDAEVAKRRQEHQEEKKLFLVEPPACEQPVDGAALLDAIVAEVRRYLIMPEHAPEAVALWILHAHAHDAFQCSPILAVVSPEKRCGKTRTLDVIRNLVPKGVFTSNTSPAAVFRIIEKYTPTLLVDEMDTFLADKDELRGVINSGHQRSGAFVMRVSGDELEPKLYSTWGPKVLAMIGKLPGTLADRSIEIPMKRKRPEERVARFRAIRPGNLPNIKRQCIRWAQDDLITLRDAALEVSVPDGLNDRAADSWEPLLTIADRVGGEWPDRARKAALALSGKGAAEDGSIGVMLLGDIKAIFEQRALNVWDWKRISSKELAESLAAMEGRPWAEWKGKPLTKNSLARLLAPFCIRPKDLRFGQRNASGYEFSAFADAFARYLPPETPSATPTTPTELNSNRNLEKSTPTDDNDVGLEKPEMANGSNGVGDVGVESPPPEGNGRDEDDDDDGGGDTDAPWELTL